MTNNDTELMVKECEALVTNYKSFNIMNQQQYEEAGAIGKTVAEKLKQVTALRKAICAPVEKSLDELKARFEPAEKGLKELKILLSSKIGIYIAEMERKQQEEQRRLDEANRKEQERLATLAKQAEKKGNVEKAEQLYAQQQAVAQSVVVATQTIDKQENVSGRKTYDYVIDDVTKIPREYLKPDEVKIGAHVRAMKESASIPGIRVIVKYGAAFGGKS